ncbi:hypothetical protein [Aquimarina sp. 433]
MKSNLIKVIICITIAVFGSSCSHEDIIETTENQKSISVINGMIVFESEEVFEETISKLMKNQSELDQWESQFKSFTSMRSSYNNLSEDDYEKIEKNSTSYHFQDILKITEGDEPEARMNIDDLVLATLVNHKGCLQIGQDVYKFRYDILYKTNFENIQNLNQIDLLDKQSLKSVGIETFEVTHTYNEVDLSDNNKADRTCDKRYWKKKRKRLKGEQWTTHIGSLYSGAGARTKHQKRTARIWWRNKTKQLRLRVNGSYTQYLQGIPSPIINVNEDTGWVSDDGREAYTLNFCVNVNCTFQIHDLTSIHECTCDDNNYERCDIIF